MAAKVGALLEAELAIEASHLGQNPLARASALVDEVEMLAQAGKNDEAAALLSRSLNVTTAIFRLRPRPVGLRAGRIPIPFARGQSAATISGTGELPAWPLGTKSKRSFEAQASISHAWPARKHMAVVLRGNWQPLFTDILAWRFDQQQQSVCGYDGQGKSTWEVRLVEPNRQNNVSMCQQPDQTLAPPVRTSVAVLHGFENPRASICAQDVGPRITQLRLEPEYPAIPRPTNREMVSSSFRVV